MPDLVSRPRPGRLLITAAALALGVASVLTLGAASADAALLASRTSFSSKTLLASTSSEPTQTTKDVDSPTATTTKVLEPVVSKPVVETKTREPVESPTLSCAKPDPAVAKRRAALRPRWVPKKSVETGWFPGRHPRRLVLKLRDDVCADADKGRLRVGPDAALEAVVRAIDDAAPGAHVARRFQHDDKVLEAARREGEERRGQRLADLSQYYWIRLAKESHRTPLLSAFVKLSAVETAYAPSLPVEPPGDILPPETPDFSGELGYWGPAPEGLDIDFAHDVVGAAGGGTGGAAHIADVEYAWNLDHEDLGVRGPLALFEAGAAGTGFSAFGDDHGTAVIGIISADADAPGIVGVAHHASLTVAPVQKDSVSNVDVAQAILDVGVLDPSRVLGARGIILIEAQATGPNTGAGQFGLVPVEYDQAEFDVIQLATSLGRLVIEAGCNGGQDLDARSAPTGDPTYERFDPAVRHSGAILVGAGTSDAPHTPVQTSNRGRRIDTYAWGEDVFSLGYGPARNDGFPEGNADPDQLYLANFAGTSSASAILGGVAAILESVHFVEHHTLSAARDVDSTALRLLLRTTGTPSDDPASDRIGRMPDLAEQLPLLAMGPNLGAVFTGAPGAGLGNSLAATGDLDGDDVDDLIVGAPFAGAGEVHLYSGASGDLIARWTGSEAGDRFGAAVAPVEDLDGDGVADVMVGAPGALGGFGTVVIRSSATGQLLRSYAGQGAGDEFGAAVATQGDVDGDGLPEILVGAPFHDRFGQNGGRVYSFSTATNALRWTKDGVSGASYGAVIVTGDIMWGDGQRDFLVGAPGDPGYGQAAAGRVFQYQSNGALWRIRTGLESFDQLGSAIAVLGDVDGDGIDDYAVGSPGERQGRGGVQLYSGHRSAVLDWVPGQAIGARFGQSLAGPGDLDRDGTVDLLVGAPFDGGSLGAVVAYGVGTRETLVRYSGPDPGQRLGTTLAVTGDVNGDGRPEFLTGAPGAAAGGAGAGRAYLFLSSRFGYRY